MLGYLLPLLLLLASLSTPISAESNSKSSSGSSSDSSSQSKSGSTEILDLAIGSRCTFGCLSQCLRSRGNLSVSEARASLAECECEWNTAKDTVCQYNTTITIHEKSTEDSKEGYEDWMGEEAVTWEKARALDLYLQHWPNAVAFLVEYRRKGSGEWHFGEWKTVKKPTSSEEKEEQAVAEYRYLLPGGCLCGECAFRLALLILDQETGTTKACLLTRVHRPANPTPVHYKADFVREAVLYDKDASKITIRYKWDYPDGFTRNDISNYSVYFHLQNCALPPIETLSMGDKVQLELVFNASVIKAEPYCDSQLSVRGLGPSPSNPSGALVQLSWPPPIHGPPKEYYHLRYGPADIRRPFPGMPVLPILKDGAEDMALKDVNATSIDLSIPLGANYAFQMCGIYSRNHKKEFYFGPGAPIASIICSNSGGSIECEDPTTGDVPTGPEWDISSDFLPPNDMDSPYTDKATTNSNTSVNTTTSAINNSKDKTSGESASTGVDKKTESVTPTPGPRSTSTILVNPNSTLTYGPRVPAGIPLFLHWTLNGSLGVEDLHSEHLHLNAIEQMDSLLLEVGTVKEQLVKNGHREIHVFIPLFSGISEEDHYQRFRLPLHLVSSAAYHKHRNLHNRTIIDTPGLDLAALASSAERNQLGIAVTAYQSSRFSNDGIALSSILDHSYNAKDAQDRIRLGRYAIRQILRLSERPLPAPSVQHPNETLYLVLKIVIPICVLVILLAVLAFFLYRYIGHIRLAWMQRRRSSLKYGHFSRPHQSSIQTRRCTWCSRSSFPSASSSSSSPSWPSSSTATLDTFAWPGCRGGGVVSSMATFPGPISPASKRDAVPGAQDRHSHLRPRHPPRRLGLLPLPLHWTHSPGLDAEEEE